ncbi:MAG: AAA family ATPase [Pseudobutyrivibrio ruminis]|uniref:AAA family ATPase n=1 Tax=Pseudobutyrivibrio ruminis TaxID=46206 RepID=UPI0026EC02D0|nr:AAA family ATPase [Pseudobutyrivibrio ruminis]MBE5913577.1 AAA family ATPase [Pseudobutyrivibrio ruminis]
MKVISTGEKYSIFPDDLKTYDRIPAGYYVVRFVKGEGFFLEKYYKFDIKEQVIYGVHDEKVHKVIDSFKEFNRNLGVILSGDKGIGKSLFARMLGVEMVNDNKPVIIVDKYIEGIGAFLDKIDQEVMVLLDEFDKTFSSSRDDECNPQTSMLSLFDGVSQGKKLFVVTCNEIRGLNSFLVNRPGRFHYHFRFDYPTAGEIRKYLEDKLKAEYYGEIDNVICFSTRVSLNYDCLRAIAYEVNKGLCFAEAIKDLNIVNIDREQYKLQVLFDDGEILTNKRFLMDSFSESEISVDIRNKNNHYSGEISFSPADIKYNYSLGTMYISPEDIELGYETYDDDDNIKLKALKSRKINTIVINRINEKQLHYVV